MKFSMLPQPVGLLKLMRKLFCTSNIQGRELCWHDFMTYMFNIVMYRDTCDPICFKLGMMLHTTKLYCLIPVWMTLMFSQGHRIIGKLELVQSFCYKVAWSNWNVCDGWLCKEDECEEILLVWQIWIIWKYALLFIDLSMPEYVYNYCMMWQDVLKAGSNHVYRLTFWSFQVCTRTYQQPLGVVLLTP